VEHWFDALARGVASKRSRRDVLRLAAGTIGAAVLSALDMRPAFASPTSDCVDFCNKIPPGPARGQCSTDCGQTGGSGTLFTQCGGDASRLCAASTGSVSCCRSDQVCVNGVCQCPTTSPTECNGRCVNLTFDFQNCGTCGTACHPSFKACINGQCICPVGHTECGGVCRSDFSSDPQNCGSCGNVCPSSAPSCCFGTCVNVQTDPNNCGGCFLSCPTGQSCVNGQCKLVCPTGQDECLGTCCPAATPTCCAGTCVDLKTNRFNCGSCGNGCPLGQDCVNGVCQKVCPSGQIACGNVCVNPQTDPNNCGGCGTSCGTGFCVNGVCKPCSDGRDRCGTNCCISTATCCADKCVDLQSDSRNCGACGSPCFTVCLDAECPCGLMCCSGVCVDTCNSTESCGSCGNSCPTGQNCCDGSCCRGVCVFGLCIAL
jgi:hypothetical protein